MRGPKDFGIEIEVEEDGKTLEENARKKADAYVNQLLKNSVSDEIIVVAGI